MDVLQLPDVYQVLALDQPYKQLKMVGHVRLFGTQREVFLPRGCELALTLEDQSFVLVVLQTVDQQLLVVLVPLVVVQQHSPQTVQNLPFLVVCVSQHLLPCSVRKHQRQQLPAIQLCAGLQGPVDDLADEGLVVDQQLVVDADLVQEVVGTDLQAEVSENVWDVLHQHLLGLQVVKTQQRQVVVNAEQHPSVVLCHLPLLAHDFDVPHQRNIYLLSQIHALEKVIVFLLLIQMVVHSLLIENLILNQHQTLNVLQIDVLLQSTGQEKEILQNP